MATTTTPRAGAVAMLLLSRIGADTNVILVMAGMLLLGLGLGQCMQPLTIIVQNAVPPSEIGVATSSATFFRQMGGTLGVAVFLSLLFSTVGDNIRDAFKSDGSGIQEAVRNGSVPKTTVNDQVLASLQHPGKGGGIVESVQHDSSVISRMADVLAHPFKVGFADSMSLVFLSAGCVMLIAFAVVWLMPTVELRATSASAAARVERESAAAATTGQSVDSADAEPEHDGGHAAPVATGGGGTPARDEPAPGKHTADPDKDAVPVDKEP